MKIIEKDGELTMRDFPTTNWATGAMLILGSLVFLGGLIVSVRGSAVRATDAFMAAVIALIWYFAYKNLSAPVITTRIKPAEKAIEMTTISPVSLKKRQLFEFSEIERFDMVSRKRVRSLLYVNTMILRDGTYIDLETEGYATNTTSVISNRLNDVLKNYKSSAKDKIIRETN